MDQEPAGFATHLERLFEVRHVSQQSQEVPVCIDAKFRKRHAADAHLKARITGLLPYSCSLHTHRMPRLFASIARCPPLRCGLGRAHHV
jgi:hypothetical protein